MIDKGQTLASIGPSLYHLSTPSLVGETREETTETRSSST